LLIYDLQNENGNTKGFFEGIGQSESITMFGNGPDGGTNLVYDI
jgi:hypothetical protein